MQVLISGVHDQQNTNQPDAQVHELSQQPPTVYLQSWIPSHRTEWMSIGM